MVLHQLYIYMAKHIYNEGRFNSDHSPQQKKDSISSMTASEAAVALLLFMGMLVELLPYLISMSSPAAASVAGGLKPLASVWKAHRRLAKLAEWL